MLHLAKAGGPARRQGRPAGAEVRRRGSDTERPGLTMVFGAPVPLLCATLALAGSEPAEVAVFTAGESGYHTFRIPAVILTPQGTLLAFAEGRKKGTSDSGDIDLVLRRSTDGGKTWSAIEVVADDGPNTIGNPCPVVDRT